MAPQGVQTGDNIGKVWYNGQYRPAEKGADGKLYVVDDNGERIEVDPNDLLGMNSDITEYPQKMVEYYDGLIAENREKQGLLEGAAKTFSAQLKTAKDTFYGFLSSCGVKKQSDITDPAQASEAEEYYESLTSARTDLRRNKSALYHTYTNEFNYALVKTDWEKQLNLAEHVTKSFDLYT